jgi:hypothetical protein
MKKGFGLMATQDIHACDLVIEYVGEVITLEDCKQVKHEPSTPLCGAAVFDRCDDGVE